MLSTIRLYVFFILSLVPCLISAQKHGDADQLAMMYLDQGEFEKANVYFDDLFDKNPEYWYTYYYKSLIGAKDLSKAEKITKRLLKQNRANVFLYVFLGKVYRLEGDAKKEKEAYEKAIKDLIAVQPHIDNLATAFKDEQLYDYAIEAYNKARKASPDYPYFYERADVYKAKNDFENMIREYLDALEFRESELQSVQTQLQNSLGYDDEKGGFKNPLLRQELQRRIQKHPDKVVLAEFLIFIQKQQRDFEGAFIQSRSLDKRLKEDGQRVYDLAKICKSNSEWEVARQCYTYLREKGEHSNYFDVAVIEGLEVEYLALTSQAQPSKEELVALEQKLENANLQYSANLQNAVILKNLAYLRAFYLGKTNEAVELLHQFIEMPGVEPAMKAEYKLLLGDIYLVKGEIWEASLLYSQVEKSFKYEAIGNEAKFRNAKLSYYAGDFAWAKAQADVLKGATSKLIANDALDLSLIISDALGVDTNDLPLRLFSSAELMILQHKYDAALARLDSINLLFSSHTLGDDIYFKKATVYMSLNKYEKVEEMYRSILEYYSDGLYGDDSQFMLAELYEIRIKDRQKAQKAYEEVLTRYPGSIFTVEARKRFRLLRGDDLNN